MASFIIAILYRMEHIGAHIEREKKRGRQTERGELLRYFMERLNRTRTQDHLPALTLPRMGRLLEKIPTKDLYYLRSVCDDSASRGGVVAFSKRFWWELDPKKHTEEAKQKAAEKTKKKFASTASYPRPFQPKRPTKRVSKRDLHNLY
jgi:hypothetical protein